MTLSLPRLGGREAAVGGALALAVAAAVSLPLDPMVEELSGLVTASPHALGSPLRGLGPLGPAASVVLNAASVVLPLPGAGIAVMNGALFGVWAGALLNVVGGVAGALVCFWLARTIGRPLVVRFLDGRSRRLRDGFLERFGLAGAAAGARRNPGLAVLAARLVPGAPFGMVSYACGVASVGWWPFVWGSVAGTAPRSLAYALLGSALRPPVWVGLVTLPALALAAVVVRLGSRRLRALRGRAAGRSLRRANTVSSRLPPSRDVGSDRPPGGFPRAVPCGRIRGDNCAMQPLGHASAQPTRPPT